MFSIYKWLEFRKRLTYISNELKNYLNFGGTTHDTTWVQLSRQHTEVAEECSRYLESTEMYMEKSCKDCKTELSVNTYGA